ncbi:hypothetical protein MJM95_29810, partial [Salmonella enterica subsp. enterica serovar Anatum]|nr:hypothetical protein [Salmonella enterica subsp. enterica serovar Anatum]
RTAWLAALTDIFCIAVTFLHARLLFFFLFFLLGAFRQHFFRRLPVIHYSVEWWNTLHQGSTRMQQSIDPAMRSPLRWAIAGFLL